MKRILLISSLFVFTGLRTQAVETASSERIQKEKLYRFDSFTLIAHRQNYLLPITYNLKPNNAPYEQQRGRGIKPGLDRVMRFETKFQLSFKFPLASSVIFDDDQFLAAYTQQSYWQVYNQNSSRPFRESNYEPEIFYLKPLDLKMGDLHIDAFSFGFIHQSNGQSDTLSRSWDRLYLTLVFSLEHFFLSIKPWYRLLDSAEDENPGIDDYVGFFDLRIAYKNSGWTYSLLVRNNLKSDLKGYREFGISFPLNEKLRGFFQYTNGYGESLIDYDVNSHRLGLGLIVSEFI